MGFCGLYGVVETEEQAEVLIRAGAFVIQLRAKTLSSREFLARARCLRELTRDQIFIVNDRVDIALLAKADGAHIGQEDLPPGLVRKLLGSARLGVSTHSLNQAQSAERAGADYIGFGPIFATRTKANPDPTVGLLALREVCQAVRIPVVAIGGITPENVTDVVRAGAAAAVSIQGIFGASDVEVAARRITKAFG